MEKERPRPSGWISKGFQREVRYTPALLRPKAKRQPGRVAGEDAMRQGHGMQRGSPAGSQSQGPGHLLLVHPLFPGTHAAASRQPARPARRREATKCELAAPQVARQGHTVGASGPPAGAAANGREAARTPQPMSARPGRAVARGLSPDPPSPAPALNLRLVTPHLEWESGCREGPHFLTRGNALHALLRSRGQGRREGGM